MAAMQGDWGGPLPTAGANRRTRDDEEERRPAPAPSTQPAPPRPASQATPATRRPSERELNTFASIPESARSREMKDALGAAREGGWTPLPRIGLPASAGGPQLLPGSRAATAERRLRSDERKRSLDLNRNAETGGGFSPEAVYRVSQLTQEEYDALGDRQRAAVDFNTALADAIEEDKGLARPRGDASRDYDEVTTRLFGERADTYAPNTVALLDALGIEDPAASLDDYLNLRSAIYETDLGTLDASKRYTGQVPSSALPDRMEHVERLTANTERLLAEFQGPGVSRSSGIVPAGGFTGTDFASRIEEYFSPAAAAMGAPERPDPVQTTLSQEDPLGLGQQSETARLEALFASVANRGVTGWTYDDLLELLAEDGIEPGVFFQYTGERLAEFEQDPSKPLAQPMPEVGGDYRTPEEIREMLGLTRVEG